MDNFTLNILYDELKKRFDQKIENFIGFEKISKKRTKKIRKKLKLKDDLERIIKALTELKYGPFVRHYKKLEGTEDKYRLTVGDFRIVYE